MAESRRNANFLLEAERQFLQQKMKTKHLIFAGRGTKYFHSLVKKRNSVSSIPALIKEDGTSTTSQEEVIEELLNYYKELLYIDNQTLPISTDIVLQGPILSEVDCSFLTAPIDDASIKEALFHIGDEKAPGPDGYTTAFFKNCWDILYDFFLQAIHEFFRNGNMLKQFNHAAIALIPKTKHALEAKDFRPISCCNVVYKTIAKIIANRLAAIM